MRVVLLGPPGAGKGTQAKIISKVLSVPHISTGDIFMKNIREETELGIKAKEYIHKGLLVPDEVTIGLVENRLEEEDAGEGYLLDGFPRTLSQGEALLNHLESSHKMLDAVVFLDVPHEELLLRMEGRRVCSSCGASYHLTFNPPREMEVCNLCSGHLIIRKDDTEEAVKERLRVYESETKPLVHFFELKGLLRKVDGTKEIDEVTEDVLEALQIKV